MVATPITVEDAGRLEEGEFVEVFGDLYEHSPWVARGAWGRRPFAGLEGLHEAFVATVREAGSERQLVLIRAHPELAGRAAAEGGLTAASTSEQALAGLDRLTPAEHERLAELNRSYREAFGFPLVVCVRDQTKESIFAEAQARLGHSGAEEIDTALGEIFKIGRLRLAERVTATHHSNRAEELQR